MKQMIKISQFIEHTDVWLGKILIMHLFFEVKEKIVVENCRY